MFSVSAMPSLTELLVVFGVLAALVLIVVFAARKISK